MSSSCCACCHFSSISLSLSRVRRALRKAGIVVQGIFRSNYNQFDGSRGIRSQTCSRDHARPQYGSSCAHREFRPPDNQKKQPIAPHRMPWHGFHLTCSIRPRYLSSKKPCPMRVVGRGCVLSPENATRDCRGSPDRSERECEANSASRLPSSDQL